MYWVIGYYKAKKYWLFGELVEKSIRCWIPEYKTDDRGFLYATEKFYDRFANEKSADFYLRQYLNYNKRKVTKIIEVE